MANVTLFPASDLRLNCLLRLIFPWWHWELSLLQFESRSSDPGTLSSRNIILHRGFYSTQRATSPGSKVLGGLRWYQERLRRCLRALVLAVSRSSIGH